MKLYESLVSRRFRSRQMDMRAAALERLSFWKRAGNLRLHSTGNGSEFKIEQYRKEKTVFC